MREEKQRYITLWRTGTMIDWDFYVSESEAEAGDVLRNLTRQGITKATTFALGALVPALCLGEAVGVPLTPTQDTNTPEDAA